MGDSRIDADPGSFRDPLSRVFVTGDAVLRGLSTEGLAEYEAVASSEFFPALMDEGLVVGTHRLDSDGSPLGSEWAATLRHDRVPIVSLPYEWSFEMLRDAALLQLEVTRRALAEGFITKDASSYNVLFDGARPVFIDVGSFERPPPGEPWPGYRQFCELFLNPLVITSVAGIPFQQWLRSSLHGISPSHVVPLIHGRKRLDRRLLVHVNLHARAEARFADSDSEHDVRDDLRRAGFGPKVIAGQLDSLERTVRSLATDESDSTWSDYSDRSHYEDADLAAKEAVVADAVASVAVEGTGPELVLDLGANDGRFSQLAVDAGAQRAVAVDADATVVDRLYRRLRATGEERILPLVLDLTDPSPGLGWRSQERSAFVDRVRPDLVLCLAVVHHLAITDTVPFDMIVDLLADFDAPVVVELPLRDDPMVVRLLSRKRPGLFDHYDAPQFEAALSRRFEVSDRVELPSGRRVLYRASPR